MKTSLVSYNFFIRGNPKIVTYKSDEFARKPRDEVRERK